MLLETFNLNGYGFYVWPAFIITLVICFILYFRTKKEFNKQENIFLKQFNKEEIEIKEVETEKKILPANVTS